MFWWKMGGYIGAPYAECRVICVQLGSKGVEDQNATNGQRKLKRSLRSSNKTARAIREWRRVTSFGAISAVPMAPIADAGSLNLVLVHLSLAPEEANGRGSASSATTGIPKME